MRTAGLSGRLLRGWRIFAGSFGLPAVRRILILTTKATADRKLRNISNDATITTASNEYSQPEQ